MKKPLKWCMRCRTRHLITTPHDQEYDRLKKLEEARSRSCPICGVKMENLAPGYWNCKRDGDFTERFLDKM